MSTAVRLSIPVAPISHVSGSPVGGQASLVGQPKGYFTKITARRIDSYGTLPR